MFPAAYGGESADLPADTLQSFLDKIASGTMALGPTNVYRFDDIRTAHADMEHNRAVGKLVVSHRRLRASDPSTPDEHSDALPRSLHALINRL